MHVIKRSRLVPGRVKNVLKVSYNVQYYAHICTSCGTVYTASWLSFQTSTIAYIFAHTLNTVSTSPTCYHVHCDPKPHFPVFLREEGGGGGNSGQKSADLNNLRHTVSAENLTPQGYETSHHANTVATRDWKVAKTHFLTTSGSSFE